MAAERIIRLIKRTPLFPHLALFGNAVRLRPELLELNLSRERTVELFKQYVEVVELETVRFCNRRCSWCPNSFIDRISTKKFMPDGIWQDIVSKLSSIDYAGTFVWSRYSEATADPSLSQKIRQVRGAMPRAWIAVISNGDYLTEKLLLEMAESGLNRLCLDAYIDYEGGYSVEKATNAVATMAQRLKCVLGITREGMSAVEARCFHPRAPSVWITIASINLSVAENFYNRSGLVKGPFPEGFVRTSPCSRPFRNVTIDWDGCVMPCCDTMSDAPQHRGYVVTKLKEGEVDVIDAYRMLAAWRRKLCGFQVGNAPCRNCNISCYPSSALSRGVYGMLGGVAMHSPRFVSPLLYRISGGHRQRYRP